MGGRGAASGMNTAGIYFTLLREIDLNEANAQQVADARRLVQDQGATAPQAMQHGLMDSPETKVSATIGGIQVNFTDSTRIGYDAIATITATVGLIPDSVKRCTVEVTMAAQQPMGYPDTIASAGTGDGRIVVYGNRELDRVTFVHEATHNYMRRNFSSPESLERTAWDEAVAAEQPGPYPQGGQNLREDFAESAALMILAPESFPKAYPRRAAALRTILKIPES